MPRSTQSLRVFLHGVPVGVAVRSRRGRVHFAYLDDYPVSSGPLSLSLPMVRGESADISDWIDGLLPDNPATRSRWASELGADSVAPFDLLSTQAGMECAGAVQFGREPTLPDASLDALVLLDETELAAMLRMISQDTEGAPSSGMGELRLSLPGAQPKLALRLTDDGWCMPTGALPTSHILKPQSGHLNPALRDSIAVNEHLCQAAAASVGLQAASTSLEMFGDEPCLVTERFDRRVDGGTMRRVHCEDLCQAMGFSPRVRYQSDGGPSPEAIIGFLRRETRGDSARRFFLSCYYNWLIGNTDGHSKNYGLILDGSAPRLAPLYDLSSAVPYVDAGLLSARPAMRFADGDPVTLQQWEQAAARLSIGIAEGELEALAAALPGALADVSGQCPDWAIDQAWVIAETVSDHAEAVARGSSAN